GVEIAEARASVPSSVDDHAVADRIVDRRRVHSLARPKVGWKSRMEHQPVTLIDRDGMVRGWWRRWCRNRIRAGGRRIVGRPRGSGGETGSGGAQVDRKNQSGDGAAHDDPLGGEGSGAAWAARWRAVGGKIVGG